MRNTTVMTLHSDSESDYEDIQDFGRRQLDSAFMDETIIFDNGLSSISASDRADINSSRHSSRHSQSSDATDTGPTTRVRRFVWRGIETSGDDQTTTDEDTTMDPVDMFNQDSDMDQGGGGGSEEDQGVDDDNEDGVQRFGMNNNALGSYLLAPMGFDDDDDDSGPSPALSGFVEAAERFQIFAGVKEFDGTRTMSALTNVHDAYTHLHLAMILTYYWRLLHLIESDQIGLEDRAYEVVPKSKKRDQERLLENKRRQGKLLLVSLLDNFCLLYDQSPERNRKLFYGERTFHLSYLHCCMG